MDFKESLLLEMIENEYIRRRCNAYHHLVMCTKPAAIIQERTKRTKTRSIISTQDLAQAYSADCLRNDENDSQAAL